MAAEACRATVVVATVVRLVSKQGSNHETPDAALASRKPKQSRPWRIKVRYLPRSRWWSHSYATKQRRDQALATLLRLRPSPHWEYKTVDP